MGILSPYLWIAVAALVMGAYVKGCTDEKTRFDQFKGGVEAIGKAQEKITAATIKSNKLAKEAADAKNKSDVADLNSAIDRLRKQRAGRSYLPTAAPGAASPEVACLKRAESERAIRDFVEGAGGLVEEGDRAIVDLNTAKGWAQH